MKLDSHEKCMKLALYLAQKAKGMTSPNPMVGCVIVKNNKIIRKGYHKKAGKEHAEIAALRNAGKNAAGNKFPSRKTLTNPHPSVRIFIYGVGGSCYMHNKNGMMIVDGATFSIFGSGSAGRVLYAGQSHTLA